MSATGRGMVLGDGGVRVGRGMGRWSALAVRLCPVPAGGVDGSGVRAAGPSLCPAVGLLMAGGCPGRGVPALLCPGLCTGEGWGWRVQRGLFLPRCLFLGGRGPWCPLGSARSATGGMGTSPSVPPQRCPPPNGPMVALGWGLMGVFRHALPFCPTATAMTPLLMDLQRVPKLPITARGCSPVPAAGALPEQRAGLQQP